MKDILDFEQRESHPLSKAKKLQYFLLLIPLTGIVFRFMHWPFASILILCGTAIAFAYGLAILSSYRIRKPSLFALATYLEGLWILLLLFGVFFRGGMPYNIYGVIVHLVTFAIFFVGFLFYHRRRSN